MPARDLCQALCHRECLDPSRFDEPRALLLVSAPTGRRQSHDLVGSQSRSKEGAGMPRFPHEPGSNVPSS